MINLITCSPEELAVGFIRKRQFNIPSSPTGEVFYITAITAIRNDGWMLNRTSGTGQTLENLRWQYGPTPGHPNSKVHNIIRYIV